MRSTPKRMRYGYMIQLAIHFPQLPGYGCY